MSAALRTAGLTRRFGGLTAVDGVSLELPAGARHALIGPNGAGKTTLINLLTGALAPSAGEVFLRGERITALGQHQRVKRGLARTFQVNSLFPGLTALESVALAVLERRGAGAHWMRAVARERDALEEAHALLARLGLAAEAGKRAPEMAYGRRRLLEIALALATGPGILLLDEPAAGIPSRESLAVLEAIAALPPEVTVLFIEHDMGLVFRFAQRITVMVGGRVLTEGTPGEISRDERVKAVYLGRDTDG
ncbi:MAG TPA: ABC transporter ATP-binding protein [Usitatibacter sp.]|nr:ABC transporter ATP-binding protein [Usitatibacter sp.]